MGLSDPLKGALSGMLSSKKSRELEEEAARKTDVMRQHEYDVARQSILGEFSSEVLSACHTCVTNAKAARRKERLDLVNRAIVACPKHATEAARLRRDMDEVENMRCAKHVYLANDPNAPEYLRDNPPPGFKKATAEQLEAMGLNKRMLQPEKSDFRAAVYIKDPAIWGPNPDPEAVIAFRGSTPSMEDWHNNFAQDANKESEYYRNAVTIGNALTKSGASVHIVGHSLGGGLASAAQGGSGLTASTYNASGLHPETVARYSHDARHIATEPDKIIAVRIDGEVLTKTQESLFGSRGLSLLANEAVGNRLELAPSHTELYFEQLKTDKYILDSDTYDSYLHGMDEVIDSTEALKKKCEETLKICFVKRGKIN
jgi:hypothetical protein